jgi:hypothetical protein
VYSIVPYGFFSAEDISSGTILLQYTRFQKREMPRKS